MRLVTGLDLETTGFLDTGDHRIIEVYAGLWDVDTRERVEELHVLIHPERSIPAAAQAVHGFSLADLAGCPTWNMVAEQVRAFILRGEAMVAHNGISFDGPFLDQEFRRISLPAHGMRILDTMVGARWATGNGKSPTLGELCFALGVPYDPAMAHKADYDVGVMMDCFFRGLDWGHFTLEETARAA